MLTRASVKSQILADLDAQVVAKEQATRERIDALNEQHESAHAAHVQRMGALQAEAEAKETQVRDISRDLAALTSKVGALS